MRTEGAMFVLFFIYFHNVIDLANTIHTVTKEKGQVIKNSLILPHKNSIPSKPHAQSYPSLNQMNTGEIIFTRKKKLPGRMQFISTCLCMASSQRAPTRDTRESAECIKSKVYTVRMF